MVIMENNNIINYSLQQNTVNIFGVIDTQMASLVIEQLLYLDNKFKKENTPRNERIITIQINSPGGAVSDGFAIYDTMNYIDATIITVGVGLAASMGAFLLSAGDKGYRRATENCEIMIHQPLGGAKGQASDIIIAAKSIDNTRKRLNSILAENTGKTVAQIKRDTDRDRILSSEEAVKYGLIDFVIPRKGKVTI